MSSCQRSLLARASGASRAACSALVLGLPLAGCSSGGAGPSPRDASPAAVGDDASTDTGVARDAGAAAPDAGPDGACGVPASFAWSSTGPILSPVSNATHDLVAIKDPSVVYFNGKWHVFVSTVDASGHYSIAYITFADWASVASAEFYYLDQNPTFFGYHAAPEVFYFRPQNKWYLVYQSGPPQYSTNDDVGNPAGWSAPSSFFGAEPAIVTQNQGSTGGWLDFKVICDAANCYLFFSDDNGTFYRSQTPIGSFPAGFGDPVVVMQDATASRLFEASNVYFMRGTGQYLALIEAFDASSGYHRYYRSWTAGSLDGTWTPLADTFVAPFASVKNVMFDAGTWTADVSHGEMIRAGYDETLTIDTCYLQYLYQGFDPSAPTNPYNGIPWKLGLLTTTIGSPGSGPAGGASGDSGGPSGATDSGTDAGGPTILFAFDKPADAPGLCANNSQGCWFWDDYDPACDVPSGSDSAASSGDGAAAACTYEFVKPVVSYDDAVGDDQVGGDPGSMQVVVPFTGYNQQSLIQWIFSPASPPPIAGPTLDLGGKTLFVRIRVDSGGNPDPASNPAGFVLAVKTGSSYAYGSSGYHNLPAPGGSSFLEIDLPLSSPPMDAATGFDATQTIAIELHFDTGSGPAAGVDAGGALPTTATFHVDTIGFY